MSVNRVPDELLAAPMPHMYKIVWLTIRKVQGENQSAYASHSHYAELCAVSKRSVTAAITALVATGWLIKSGKHLTCEIGSADVATLDSLMRPRKDSKWKAEKSDKTGDAVAPKEETVAPKEATASPAKSATASPNGATASPVGETASPPSESLQGIQSSNPGRVARPREEASPGNGQGTLSDTSSPPFDPVALWHAAFPAYRMDIYSEDMTRLKVTDRPAWEETIEFWAGNHYRAYSVQRAITKYHEILAERQKRQEEDTGFEDPIMRKLKPLYEVDESLYTGPQLPPEFLSRTYGQTATA